MLHIRYLKASKKIQVMYINTVLNDMNFP